jgi:glycogen debranching enzyme
MNLNHSLLIMNILVLILAACTPAPEGPGDGRRIMDDKMTTEQILRWSDIEQRRISAPDTLFANTGRRIYIIGDIDGDFRPRSNPYDLHAYGKPDPNDPLANELQGVWAQPVKGLDGFTYTIQTGAERWDLVDASKFIQTYTAATFEYQRDPIKAVRTDFASQDLPIFFTSLTLHNAGNKPYESNLIFKAHFDLEDAWFTSLGAHRNNGERLSVEGEYLVARAALLPDNWAVAVGGSRVPNEKSASTRPQNPTGELHYNFRLEPQQSQTWTFGVVIETSGGAQAALANLAAWLPQYEQLLAEKETLYHTLAESGPHFTSPDPALNAAFALAGANLQALEAEAPALGRYFYAGLEMFPFWFSNDGAYSAPGLLASGFGESVMNHVRIGGRFANQGAIPHQISPAGHVAFESNAQETAQWVMGLWDVYRWTGNREFLKEQYPAAVTGMFEHTLGRIDPDGDGYASGPGMVEAPGMGEEKLDTAAYTWAALNSLAAMAEVLDDPAIAERAGQAAQDILSRFDTDWWDADSRSYSMSLDSENRRAHVPHWAIVIPLEVGLASPTYAAQTLSTVEANYLNEWGIKHTIGTDERVWTLPVATLSRAAYRYKQPALGFHMLNRIAETLHHGSIGMFHELIPEGACFIQLWSAATFRRGVIEDLLGIEVNAAEQRMTLSPQLPPDWDEARLETLTFGDYVVDITLTPEGGSVWVRSGPSPLTVVYWRDGEQKQAVIKAGEQWNL